MDIIIDKIDCVINKNVINEMGIINTFIIITILSQLLLFYLFGSFSHQR